MANFEALGLELTPQHAHAFGNVAVATGQITLSAANTTDVLRFVRLPAEAELLDAILIVSDASNATVTMNLGFEFTDGTSGDDATHFLGATALSALLHQRADGINPPVKLSKDAYISGVIAGANITESTVIDVIVFYRFNGK